MTSPTATGYDLASISAIAGDEFAVVKQWCGRIDITIWDDDRRKLRALALRLKGAGIDAHYRDESLGYRRPMLAVWL